LDKIKGERIRLGNDEVTKKVLEGIDDSAKRQSILRSVDNSWFVSKKKKEETKAALVFCWDEIDRAGRKISGALSGIPNKVNQGIQLPEEPQQVVRSKLYQATASMFRAIGSATSKLAECFKKQTPDSVEAANSIAHASKAMAPETRIEGQIKPKQSTIMGRLFGSRGR